MPDKYIPVKLKIFLHVVEALCLLRNSYDEYIVDQLRGAWRIAFNVMDCMHLTFLIVRHIFDVVWYKLEEIDNKS